MNPRKISRNDHPINYSPVDLQTRQRVRLLSVVFMILAPIFIGWGLSALFAYTENDLMAYYPTTAVNALYWLLYFTIPLLSSISQYAGFGVLGYSVMRYGVRRSAFPIVLSIPCVIIKFAGDIGITLYTIGIVKFRNDLTYILSVWITNLFLDFFTCFCVIFLCAVLRASFRHRGKLSVYVAKEERAERKHNVLRKLYLWTTFLLFFFGFVTALLGTIGELRQVGAPESVWDWITLFEPYFELIIRSVIGFFTQLMIGRYLTVSGVSKQQQESSSCNQT